MKNARQAEIIERTADSLFTILTSTDRTAHESVLRRLERLGAEKMTPAIMAGVNARLESRLRELNHKMLINTAAAAPTQLPAGVLGVLAHAFGASPQNSILAYVGTMAAIAVFKVPKSWEALRKFYEVDKIRKEVCERAAALPQEPSQAVDPPKRSYARVIASDCGSARDRT